MHARGSIEIDGGGYEMERRKKKRKFSRLLQRLFLYDRKSNRVSNYRENDVRGISIQFERFCRSQ